MGDWIGCVWEFFMQCNGKIHGIYPLVIKHGWKIPALSGGFVHWENHRSLNR